MPLKSPNRFRVDTAMEGNFRRPLKVLAEKPERSVEQFPTVASAVVERIEQAYLNNSREFDDEIDAALITSGIKLRDAGLERNAYITSLEKALAASNVIPSMLKEGFMDKFRDAVESLVVEGREGASKRARGRHAKALTPMLSAMIQEPDLRRNAVLTKDRAEKLIAASVRVRDDGTRERHADLAPFFVNAITNDEARYYLSLAIDDDTNRRSEKVISDIEKRTERGEKAFIPVICIGTGVYGQVVANELMASLPDVMERDVLFLDAADHLGGQFAEGTRAVFKVNNRVRPEDVESLARPGTPDNIMPLGDHAVIDLPMVSAQTYPSQNLLGASLKTNAYLNMHQGVTNARVVGIRKSNTEGRYAVEFVRNNQLYTIETNIVMIGDGIGESRPGFTDGFDVATRELLAESRQAGERGESRLYYTFQDFIRLAARETSGNWREQLNGDGVIIGAGDSGIVTVAALLGYGPDDVGATQIDFTKKISWIGQSSTNAAKWCAEARPRYVDLAREFPRETLKEAQAAKRELGPRVFLTPLRNAFEPVRIAFERLSENETQENRRKYFEMVRAVRQANPTFSITSFGEGDDFGKISAEYFKAQAQIEGAEASTKDRIEGETETLNQFQKVLLELKTLVEKPVRNIALVEAIKKLVLNQDILLGQAPDVRFPLTFVDQILFANNFLGSIQGFSYPPGYTYGTVLSNRAAFNGSGLSELPERERKLFEQRIVNAIKIIDNQRKTREQILAKAAGEGIETSSASQESSNESLGYSRIVPVVSKAARAEKFTDDKGKERVRVFCEDGKVVETDWVIDASGVTSRTNELFRDFQRETARNTTFVPTLPIFQQLFLSSGFQFQIDESTKNPLLRNLILRTLRVENKESGQALSIIRINTPKNQEFEVEFLRDTQKNIRVISSSSDYDAIQIARALQDWAKNTEPIAKNATIIGGVIPDIFAKDAVGLAVSSIRITDADTLIPVASQVTEIGKKEKIFFLGPANRFGLSNEERETIPALSKVTANLQSMFRYVGPTGKFVSEVLVKEIEQLALSNADAQISVPDRQERAPWRDGTDIEFSPIYLTFDEVGRGIPSIANPKVLLSYFVRQATLENVVQKRGEDGKLRRDERQYPALPESLSLAIDRDGKTKTLTVRCLNIEQTAAQLWNFLASDERFVQAFLLTANAKGKSTMLQLSTKTGEITSKRLVPLPETS